MSAEKNVEDEEQPESPNEKGEMAPPKTFDCQEEGCEKRYSRVQDLLGHYNTKHRDVEVPIIVYKWKQVQDAKPKVECPYCAKFFLQNINRHIENKHPEKLKGKSNHKRPNPFSDDEMSSPMKTRTTRSSARLTGAVDDTDEDDLSEVEGLSKSFTEEHYLNLTGMEKEYKRDMDNGKVEDRFCPDCVKMFRCTAMQLMTHMMKVHPVKNAGLVASSAGQTLLAAAFAPPTSPMPGKKRNLFSPETPSTSKRRLMDSGVTDTPSTASPKTKMSSKTVVTCTLSKDQMENLTRGIEEGFLYRVWNTFRGQTRAQIVRTLRRGPLHPSDTNLLIWEAEDREVKVSDLIEAILGFYIHK